MTVTVFAMLTVNDDNPQALAKYFEITGPLLEAAGARILQRFEIHDVIVGETPAKSVVIVEYPDMEALKSVFESTEYKAITEIRDAAFLTYQVSVVGN